MGARGVLVLGCALAAVAARGWAQEPGAAPREGMDQGADPGADLAVAPRGLEAPDVVLVVIDDLNDWVGHLGGHPDASTPHLDALAERGATFTNAHCAAPVCNPSRTALFSGRRPAQVPLGQSWRKTLEGLPTLTDHFGAAGYLRWGTGKLYHGDAEGQFDEFHRVRRKDELFTRSEDNHTGLRLSIANQDGFDWHGFDIEDSAMPDYRRVDWALERLSEPRERPVFLAVGFHLPHLPWYVPQRWLDLHPLEEVRLPEVLEGDQDDLPRAALKLIQSGRGIHRELVRQDQWRSAVRAYLGTCSFVDAQVGRLMEGLEASPRGDHTIVLVTSDHGWHLGEKQHWRKQSLWSDATRVPLIVVPPASRGPFEPFRSGAPVDTLSVYGTLAELAGLGVPEHVDGPSLVPLLDDPAVAWPHVALTTQGGSSHALVTERWRYIRYRGGDEELYDILADPHEFQNLAGDGSEETRAALEQLRGRLDGLVRGR